MDTISNYLNYLQATKNLSDKTLKAYLNDLNQFNIGVTLQRIALDTGVNGVAISVINLLLIAEKLKTNMMSYQDFYNKLNLNNELQFL